MTTNTFTHRALTAVGPVSVWRKLQDAGTWKALGGIDVIRDPRHTADGSLQGFDFTSSVGGLTYDGKARTVSSEPHRLMVVDIDTTEIEAELTVDLDGESHAPGTTLAVVMRLSPKSFLASTMWAVIASTVGEGLGDRVHEMVETFEHY